MMTGNAQTDVGHIPGVTCPLSGPFWGAGNILLGGAGSDTLMGRGADDVIDGDSTIGIRIDVRTAPNGGGTLVGSTDLMEHPYLAGSPKTLQQAVFDGTVDAGNLVAVRTFSTPASPGSADTAVFSGPLANYTVSNLAVSPITVTDNTGADGTDTLYGIEKLQFTDQTISIVPNGVLSPTSLTFGGTFVGATAPSQTVTITNQGGQQSLVITALSVSGTITGDFRRAPAPNAGTCGATPITLTTNQSCTVAVQFTPQAGAAGARSGVLRFTDNHNGAAGTNQDVPLSGTALASQPVAGVNPASITFSPAVNVGSPSAVSNVTLSNTGNATLNIASIAPTGTNAGDFARVAPTAGTNCATTLAAGSSCTVGVRFTPTAAGTRSAFMTFTDDSNNAAGSTQNVSLTGTGTAVAGIASPTPNPVAFGARQVNVAVTSTVTMRNTGNSSLTLAAANSAVVAGTDFTRNGGSCANGQVLAANATCTVIVQFRPTAVAARTGTLTFTDNSGGTAGSTQVVNLTGNGVAATISVNPTSLAFGNNGTGLLGLGGVSRSTTITNTGVAGTMLIIGAPTITGTNASMFTVTGNNCPAAGLARLATCTITVRFRATSTGAKTASLSIPSNATTSPTILNMTGTGVFSL